MESFRDCHLGKLLDSGHVEQHIMVVTTGIPSLIPLLTFVQHITVVVDKVPCVGDNNISPATLI